MRTTGVLPPPSKHSPRQHVRVPRKPDIVGAATRLQQRMQDDPEWFVREILGGTPWSMQVRIMNAVRDCRRVAVRSSHGAGKCVPYDEPITLASGARVRAETLIGKEFQLLTVANGDFVSADARAADNGVDDIYELVTDSGKVIRRSAEHPLWVTTGVFCDGKRPVIPEGSFVPIRGIEVGQLVAVAEELPAFGPEGALRDEEVKLLALLIGDGGTTNEIRFSQMEGVVLDDFTRCVDAFGCVVKHAANYDYRVVASGPRGGIPGSNPVLNFCREHGLHGCKAVNKRVPAAIFAVSERQSALFLRYLYATDGWAYSSGPSGNRLGRAEIGYGTSSEGLAHDVLYLLQKHGVHARLSYKPKVRSWTISITDAMDQARFAERIGIFGKEELLQRVIDLKRDWLRRKAASLAKFKAHLRWCWKSVADHTRWEKVVGVKHIGAGGTVAIEVPGYDTYFTQFYEHNTMLAAWTLLWYLYSYPESKVITTAPTFNQVKELLWRYVRTAHSKAKFPLGGEPLNTSLELGPEWFAIGLSTDSPERFQGFHAERLLVIVDEASGVPDSIFGAAEGFLTAEHSRILLLGNPTQLQGEFFDAFHSSSGAYQTFHISYKDTPNFTHRGVPCPYLITPTWVEEKRRQWGEDSPLWYVKVLGEFPMQGDDTLIPLKKILDAQDRWDGSRKGTPIRIGVDVARFGTDATVIATRHGCNVRVVHVHRSLDLMATAGAVLSHIRQWKPEATRIDAIGIGAGVADRLIEQGYMVDAVNVGEAAVNNAAHLNLRAEAYWELRKAFMEGTIAIPPDDDILASQLSTLHYKFDSKGRLQMEAKEDIRRRGGSSPDRADAVVLAWMTRTERAGQLWMGWD